MSESFRFFHPLRVRWAECDMQGIVFNPHYLMYFDVALTEYMRAIGLPYPAAFAAAGTDTFMVSAQIDFRASARYDDELRIGVRTAYFGTTSFPHGALDQAGRASAGRRRYGLCQRRSSNARTAGFCRSSLLFVSARLRVLRRKGRSKAFFFEKRSKKFLSLGARVAATPT